MKIILTGATGMVGEGVLLECLNHPAIDKVLIINRRPSGYSHRKLREVLHSNFMDLNAISHETQGYDACFFCLGVSSVFKNKEEYYRMTYTLTLHVAEVLSQNNKGMVFCYVSGAGTRSSEKGGMNWARVKGKTENDLRKLPFRKVYAYRPGVLKATKGQKHLLKGYTIFAWLPTLMKWIAPSSACSLKELGLSMINVSGKGFERDVLEVKDIIATSRL